MFRIAICEDEKVILEYESSLVKEWGEARGCALELDEYVSAEQFLGEKLCQKPKGRQGILSLDPHIRFYHTEGSHQ